MKHVHEDKRYNKKSLQAISVAKEVINRVQSGKRINLREIQVSKGYSLASAKSQKAMRTKSYQGVIKPVIEQLELIRQKSLSALLNKNHDEEKYRDLVEGVDKLTKNTQLLSGKSTENIANNIVVYGDDDFLALQVNASDDK